MQNKFACYETVYIISNWSLEDQYKEVQKDNPESWKAFLRRIHEVTIYKEDGTLTHYDSVEAYLKRKEKIPHHRARRRVSVCRAGNTFSKRRSKTR